MAQTEESLQYEVDSEQVEAILQFLQDYNEMIGHRQRDFKVITGPFLL